MSETFLARWSRQKDEARRAEREPEAPDRQAPAEEAALTEQEIAALPKIESITAETDISVFMRRGVPAALRKAALRRAWTADPAIRDFVGHARDYDYDWNVPGGAPGYEPLRADEAVAMARRVFGAPPEPEPVAEAPAGPPAEKNS
jgi:hypothetical protein